MSAARLWPIWLIFAGVFLAGAVTGGFISLRVTKTLVDNRRGPDQFTPRMMERLDQGLELTEAQRKVIEATVEKTWKDLRAIRGTSVETMRTMEAAIAQILTPEQKVKYNKMQEKQREHWNSMTSERRGPGSGPGIGPRPRDRDGEKKKGSGDQPPRKDPPQP